MRPMVGNGCPVPNRRNSPAPRVSHLHMTRDHVCDMDVDERTATATTEYAGDTYYFCSDSCKNKFVADPEKYVSRTEASQT
jgi:YHS domain-containing protein